MLSRVLLESEEDDESSGVGFIAMGDNCVRFRWQLMSYTQLSMLATVRTSRVKKCVASRVMTTEKTTNTDSIFVRATNCK